MPLRYGLIGSGMMGQEHIRNLKLLDDIIVTAISDPDEGMQQRSIETSGGSAQTFGDHKDLLSADLCDAYIIAAPNDLHHAILLDVLAAGKPILCEKPLCTTSQDCRDIISKASGARAPIWVAVYAACSASACRTRNRADRIAQNDGHPRTPFSVFGKNRRLESL